MPFATGNGIRLYWRLDGAAEGAPLVLLNAIGTDMTLWDGLVPLLQRRFRILRFDARGHGASDSPPGDYSFEMLAHDVLAVMQAANLLRAAIAGVSLGGMIAMETALRFPQHVAALVLICTSADIDRPLWTERVKSVHAGGVAAIADGAMARFLSPQFAAAHPETAASIRRTLLSTQGYTGAATAIRDGELRGRVVSGGVCGWCACRGAVVARGVGLARVAPAASIAAPSIANFRRRRPGELPHRVTGV